MTDTRGTGLSKDNFRFILESGNAGTIERRGAVQSLCKDYVKFDPADPGIVRAAEDLRLGAFAMFQWFRGETATPTNRDKQMLLAIAASCEASAIVLGVDLQAERSGFEIVLEEAKQDPEFCKWMREDKIQRRVDKAESFQGRLQSRALMGGRGAGRTTQGSSS